MRKHSQQACLQQDIAWFLWMRTQPLCQEHTGEWASTSPALLGEPPITATHFTVLQEGWNGEPGHETRAKLSAFHLWCISRPHIKVHFASFQAEEPRWAPPVRDTLHVAHPGPAMQFPPGESPSFTTTLYHFNSRNRSTSVTFSVTHCFLPGNFTPAPLSLKANSAWKPAPTSSGAASPDRPAAQPRPCSPP